MNAGMVAILFDLTTFPSPNLKSFELSTYVMFVESTELSEDLNSLNQVCPQTVFVAPLSRTAEHHVSDTRVFRTVSLLVCRMISFNERETSLILLSGHSRSQWLIL